MKPKKCTPELLCRMKKAWRCLCGNGNVIAPTTTAAAPVRDASIAELQSALSKKEFDCNDRDEKIARMTQEFLQLRQTSDNLLQETKIQALIPLVKRAGPVFGQIATMKAIHESGKNIQITDVFNVFEVLEQAFEDAGCTPVGEIGKPTLFDSRIHQRMSGASVNDGDVVIVRFPGYTVQGIVAVKASVSKKQKEL